MRVSVKSLRNLSILIIVVILSVEERRAYDVYKRAALESGHETHVASKYLHSYH